MKHEPTREAEKAAISVLTPRRQDAKTRGKACFPVASLRLCALAFLLLPISVLAATNDLPSALQKGLFEEEANHNLEAAAAAYQAVSAQFDKDRKLAATAIFRLGEVYRKQGKTNEAVVQYERIVREFSDQETLARLSRQNLAGFGRGVSTTAAAAGLSEPSAQLIAARTEVASLEAELVQLKSLSTEELRLTVPHNYPNPTLNDLLKKLAAAQQTRVGLQKDFSPEHPEVARVTAQVDWLENQIRAQVSGTVRALEVKLSTAKAVLDQLGTTSAAVSPAARAEQRRLLEAEIKLLERKIESEKLRAGAGRADGMTLIATQRELLALKRHLAVLSPGATPEDIRAEQGRLLDEEIGLVERKLARARAMAADGQDQGVLSDTERELLALQRQRVALASDPLLATTSEAAATLVTDEEEKEKEIRRLQRALFRLRWPTTSPEQMRRQIEAARTAQQERLDAATGLMERLRVSLSVPDDIAVMDADKGMDDPRLVKYRAYFEAKSTRDGARRFGQVLYGKLATEEIELDLFRQYDALDN